MVLLGTILVLLTTSSNFCNGDRTTRMIHGEYAGKKQFPYVVSIRTITHNAHLCAGSVINTKHVLTAAACFSQTDAQHILHPAGDLKVFGNTIQSDGLNGFRSDVKSLILHPDYHKTQNSINNNIAILSVHKALYWFWQPLLHANKIKPISAGTVGTGAVVTAIGWGSIDSNGTTKLDSTLNYEKFVTLPSDSEECRFSVEFLCAIPLRKDGGTCSNDAGGPLVTQEGKKDKLVGLVSHVLADNCGIGATEVFTRIESYVVWIEKISGTNIMH